MCSWPFEHCKYFIKYRHNCRTGSFLRRTLLVKLASLPFCQLVDESFRRCVLMWSGTRKIVVLLFIVLELHRLVHCCYEPAEAPFSLCDVFEHTAGLIGSKNIQEIKYSELVYMSPGRPRCSWKVILKWISRICIVTKFQIQQS